MNGPVSTKTESTKSGKLAESASLARQSRAGSGLQANMLVLQRAAGNQAASEFLRTQSDNLVADLQEVHIHTGPATDAQVRAQGSAAYASGRDVFLGSRIDLATDLGQRVLAHELTHIAQQERGQAGMPLSSEASLEAEAGAVSGIGAGAGFTGVGAAAPGSVQRVTQTEVGQELEGDIRRIKKELDSVVYTEGVEETVLGILRNWAARGSLASGYLEWIFDGLQTTKSGVFGDTTYYDAMLDRFDRADEVRQLRDSTKRHRGQESAEQTQRQAKESAERKEEDLFAESLFGWKENRFESAPAAKSPHDIFKANLVIRTLAAIPSDQLTPEQRVLSEGIAREGQDFLLKRTHEVTAGDRLRFGKQLLRQAVVMMLEYALAELTMGAARAIAPKILEGLVGAEAAGAEALGGEAASVERGLAGAERGLASAERGIGREIESAGTKEAAAGTTRNEVISIEGRARTGTIEGLTPGERPVTNLSEYKAMKTAPTTPPTEPTAQALPKAVNEDVEAFGSVAEEQQAQVGMKKAAGAEAETAEPIVATKKGGPTGGKSKVPQSSLKGKPSKGAPPISKYTVTEYGRFNIKGRVGDPWEGHEVLLNSWLERQGLITRRGRGLSRFNSAIALSVDEHATISAMQRARLLYDEAVLDKMTARQVIAANAQILLDAGLPMERVIAVVDDALELLSGMGGKARL